MSRTVTAVLLITLFGITATVSADEALPSNSKRTIKGAQNPADTLVTVEMIEAALDLPCPNLQFTGEHDLTEFLEVFEAHWSKQLHYDVPFFSDRAELDLEGITSLEDVQLADVKIQGGTHTCRDALELIFEQTTDPELMFQPAAGHIDVTTLAKGESEANLISRVYDITDFLGEQPQAKSDGKSSKKKGRKKNGAGKVAGQNSPQQVLKQFGQAAGGSGCGTMANLSGNNSDGTGPSVSEVIQLIQEQTSPPAKWFIIDGEGGQMSVLGQYIVVRQTYLVHRQIEGLLNDLRVSIKSGGPPANRQVTTPGLSGNAGGMGGGGGGQSGGGPGFFQVVE